MRRPHIVLASHELAPIVQAGGIGRHVAYAAALLAPTADVTVVLPSGTSSENVRLVEAKALLDGVTVHLVERDEAHRRRFASPFQADAAEVASALATLMAECRVDLVEVDDYLGLGAGLVDAAATGWRGLQDPVLSVRLHTTWEMAQVLNRETLASAQARWLCALERRALRRADVLLAPDVIAGAVYERFYGRGNLAPLQVLPPASAPLHPGPDTTEDRRHTGPLRLLFVGRLEERKGVRALTEAVLSSDDDVELVFAGGDTATAPGGGSMRAHLEQIAAGDSRLTFLGRLDPGALDAVYAAADLVVLPSRFESFGYVLREALARGRPVLATPTAGFSELLADSRAGWLAGGFDAAAIADALRRVLSERERLEELLVTGAPRVALEAQATTDGWVTAMLALSGDRGGREYVAPAGATVAITAVIIVAGGDLARTLRALHAQRGADVEVVVAVPTAGRLPAALLEIIDDFVVCDADDALARALRVRKGNGPVLVVHAGDSLAADAAARLHAALSTPACPAFVTAWSAGHEARARPLGAPEAHLVADFGVAGASGLLTAAAATDAVAGGADPLSWLAAHGAEGVVIPEELFGLQRRRRMPDADAAAAGAASLIAFGRELWDPLGAAAAHAP